MNAPTNRTDPNAVGEPVVGDHPSAAPAAGAASGSRIDRACAHLKNDEAALVARLVAAGWPDFGIFWGDDDGRNWVEIGGGVNVTTGATTPFCVRIESENGQADRP